MHPKYMKFIFLSSPLSVMFIQYKNCLNFSQSEHLTELIFIFEFKLGLCVQNFRPCPRV